MKKETAILAIVIAFIVGFVAGAVVAILKGRPSTEMPVVAQKAPETEGAPTPGEALPSPEETAAKIQALKDILRKDPKNLSALVELGNLYFDTKQPKEAIDAYSKYLAIKPDNPDVRTDMGIMYRQLGNYDEALKQFRMAAQSDPKHAESRYNIGIVLLHDKHDIKGAVSAWEDYLKVDPNSERAKRLKDQMDKLRSMAK